MNYKKIIFMLDSTGAVDDIKKYYNNNLNNAEFLKTKANYQLLITKESELKKHYLDQFKVAYDSNYWKSEVIRLNNASHLSVDEQAVNQRLLGFLSLLGYSYTNRVLINNQLEFMPILIHFYETVDPKNTDVFYFKAVYALKKNKPVAAVQALQDAYKLGYREADKLLNDEYFSPLKNDAEFLKLIAKMKEK
jgi:hypothetical protein